jgi:hypothetical protein
MMKNSKSSEFVSHSSIDSRPNSRNSNMRHDGILSIENFMLMINKHSANSQLSSNWSTTKKYAPYFRGNTEFLSSGFTIMVFGKPTLSSWSYCELFK